MEASPRLDGVVDLVICALGLSLWLMALGLAAWGTFLTVRHLKFYSTNRSNASVRYPAVSILKPLKGRDAGLDENIESFFRLDYPRYELLFSVASADDPARPLVETLIAKYPRVRAQLTIGEVKVGANPKVNNLVRGYNQARHDLILISDSNTRAQPAFLKSMVLSLDADVGVVTALVRGDNASGAGGCLETVFLNTFYARWMLVALHVGSPVVVGKAMLFRRSEANRFGGMAMLARYLAEDYMAGQAMRFLGRKIKVASEPITQPLGVYSLKEFWSRHLRWGRIRKSQAPLAFLFEPFLSMWFSGLIGAWTLNSALGISFFGALGVHLGLWFLSDLVLMHALGERKMFRSALTWIFRESIHLPLWAHIAIGRTVMWRGSKLVIARGGILET